MIKTVRRLVRWTTGHVLPPLAYPVLRGPLRGARFVLGAAAGEGGGASVYVNAVEPAKTQALLGILRSGQTVFDIGANIGYYTLLASRTVGSTGRVLACEPSPRNLAYLHRHLALNRATNVSIIAAACADRPGLFRFDAGAGCAEGHLAADTAPGKPFQLVPAITVDDLVRESGLRPDVMKIDVEGAEERVLRGAVETLRSARPVVLVGVHSGTLRAACTALLTASGYGDPVVCEELPGDTELLFTPRNQQPAN